MSNPFTAHHNHNVASLPSTNPPAATGHLPQSNDVFDPLAYTSSSTDGDSQSHINNVEPFRYRSEVPPAATAALTTGSDRAEISKQEQKEMMESIVEIFHLDEEEVREDVEMGEGDEEVVDFEDQKRRTERLSEALEMLGKLWWARSEFVEVVTEKLADGSRDRELLSFWDSIGLRFSAWAAKHGECHEAKAGLSAYVVKKYLNESRGIRILKRRANMYLAKWRIPLGDSGILNFYLDILSTQTLQHALKIQVLRLVGNSCADTGTISDIPINGCPRLILMISR